MKKILLLIATVITVSSCAKPPIDHASLQQDAGLIKDWIGLQLRLIKNTTGVTHTGYARHFAYTGLALYQSLEKAQPGNGKFAANFYEDDSPSPNNSGRPLFAPAAMNAAIADMLRFFYGSKEANLASIDSLEAVYVTKHNYLKPPGFDLPASIQLGKTTAHSVMEKSKEDGAANASIPYTPLGEGYWEPTAPGFAAAAVPGWGNNKTILPGSIDNISFPQPLQFSTDPTSPFYAMAKEVYEASKMLTPDQKAMAAFWDDAPNGKCYTAFGHWFSILKQVLEQKPVSLHKAAKAYLQLGISINDAAICAWKAKFTYNQLRPISYIRKYMNDPTWNSFINTPPHPEYIAAHATLSSAAAFALEAIFGKNFSFTDHSYDHLGMQARSYAGFEAVGTEAGLSRLYGGIHYRYSIETGQRIGKLVGAKVDSILNKSMALPLYN